jgi:hypothetical protein
MQFSYHPPPPAPPKLTIALHLPPTAFRDDYNIAHLNFRALHLLHKHQLTSLLGNTAARGNSH